MKSVLTYAIIFLCSTTLLAEPATTVNNQSATKKTVTKQPAKTVKKTADAGVMKILCGILTSVNVQKNIITIKVKSGNYPVNITKQSILSAGNKKITIADLKIGDYVSVNYLRFANSSRNAIDLKKRIVEKKIVKQQPKPTKTTKAKTTKVTPVKSTQKPSVQTQKKTIKPEKTAVSQGKAISKVLGGIISIIDNDKKIITVKIKSGNYPILIDNKTGIVAGNNKISFANLKIGDRVTINYKRLPDGKRVAGNINNITLTAKLAKEQLKNESAKKPVKKKK